MEIKRDSEKHYKNIDKYLSDCWEKGRTGVWLPNGDYKYIFPADIHKIPLTRKEIEEKFPHDNETNDMNYPYFFEDIKKRLDGRPVKEVTEILIQKDRFQFTILDYICMYIYKKDNLEYFMDFFKTAPIGFFKNYENIRGENPLHICAKCKNTYALKILLKLGFDQNQKNKENKTVKDILENHKKICQREMNLYQQMIEELY